MKPAFYRCAFKFNNVRFVIDNEVFDDLRSGFWVNDTMEYVNDFDFDNRKYWIPPATIMSIEAIREENE